MFIMNNKKQLLKEIEEVPEDKIHEVIDFVRFVKMKGRDENIDSMLISESSLAEAWNNPMDDEVWSDL